MSFLVQENDSGMLQNMQHAVTTMWSAIADIYGKYIAVGLFVLQLF